MLTSLTILGAGFLGITGFCLAGAFLAGVAGGAAGFLLGTGTAFVILALHAGR